MLIDAASDHHTNETLEQLCHMHPMDIGHVPEEHAPKSGFLLRRRMETHCFFDASWPLLERLLVVKDEDDIMVVRERCEQQITEEAQKPIFQRIFFSADASQDRCLQNSS